jgi:hypothetical protein
MHILYRVITWKLKIHTFKNPQNNEFSPIHENKWIYGMLFQKIIYFFIFYHMLLKAPRNKKNPAKIRNTFFWCGWKIVCENLWFIFCYGLIKNLKKYSHLSKGAMHIFSGFLLLSGLLLEYSYFKWLYLPV